MEIPQTVEEAHQQGYVTEQKTLGEAKAIMKAGAVAGIRPEGVQRDCSTIPPNHKCWEGDCDHDRNDDGNCTALVQHAVWCRGCTPVYVSGGEFDGTPYDECQVDWPCSPVLAMCASFGVSLTGKALPTDRPE